MNKEHIYKSTTLDNGFEIHSLKMANAQKNYTEVRVRSGSACESIYKTGVAHYLEHMFLYGSDEWSEDDLLPYFNDLGGEYNFGTGSFLVNYYAYALPYKTQQYLERISSIILNPVFTEKHVEQERLPIITELVLKLDALDNDTLFHSVGKAFPNHRISIPNIGTKNHVEQINYSDLREYYESFYVA